MRTLAVFLAAACVSASAWAQRAAVVQLSLGTAAVVNIVTGARQPLAYGAPLNVGDVIQTGDDGLVHAVFGDGSLLAVRPNSAVRIAGFTAEGKAADALWLELMEGAFRAVTGWIAKARPASFRVTTPTVVIGVRGTDFELVQIAERQASPAEPAGTHVLVHEGAAVIETQAGRLEVTPGQAAFAARAQESPRLHTGVPAFLRDRGGKLDSRVEEHGRRIGEHMESSLKERGLLRAGESAQRYIERTRAEPKPEAHPPQRPPRAERPQRPEKPERPGHR